MAEQDLSQMSFEDALGALEAIVRDLESGQAPLEKSIELYERGTALKKHCEAKLNEAKAKIEMISVSADGTITTKPFEE